MLLKFPTITNRLPIDLDLYGIGLDLLTITGAWIGALLMVLVQHLLKRSLTAQAGGQCDEERRSWQCN